MRKKFLLTLASAFVAIAALAQPVQDRTELERERQQIQKELKDIQGMYDKVKGQTKQTLGQLNVLNRKIALQEQYINNINREIHAIDDDIYLSNLEIYRLQKQLDTLKAEYARSVVYAYKNKSSYDYLNFIFSANSFNDAIRRISYLKNYRAYRERQVKTILETQELINRRKQQQLSRKDQKNNALSNQTEQVEVLATQKKEKDAVVSQLKSKQKDLQGQIAERKKKDAKLRSAIFAIIERERQKAIEEEKKRLAASTPKVDPTNVNPTTSDKTVTTKKPEVKTVAPKTYVPLNPDEVQLAADFKSNYGRLPWPVDNGVVCSSFGINQVEGFGVTEDNPGITICTQSAGVNVKAVFNGEVLSVFNLGDNVSVMIKHGNYYTVYSNLASANVGKGQKVTTGQVIGKGGSDENGGGKVDFILMQDKRNVNPKSWLR